MHSMPIGSVRTMQDDTIDKDDILKAVQTKRTYAVSVPEVWIRTVYVEAVSADEAKVLACEGIMSGSIVCGGVEGLQFSHEYGSSMYDATPL